MHLVDEGKAKPQPVAPEQNQKRNPVATIEGDREMKAKLMNFLRDEKGLTTVEYAIAGGLIGAAVIAAFEALGGTVSGIITNIDTLLQ